MNKKILTILIGSLAIGFFLGLRIGHVNQEQQDNLKLIDSIGASYRKGYDAGVASVPTPGPGLSTSSDTNIVPPCSLVPPGVPAPCNPAF